MSARWIVRWTCTLGAVLVASAAFGADWYVAAGGNDGNKGGADSPFRSITRALMSAMSGDTVNVSRGAYTTASGEQFPLRLSDGVRLRGEGADLTTVYGDLTTRLVECRANVMSGEISGFTFQRGRITEDSIVPLIARGGAIYCAASGNRSFVIQRNDFENNIALGHFGGGAAQGGAIYGTNLAIVNNVFLSNRALGGVGTVNDAGLSAGGPGGDAIGGALVCFGLCTLQNNTFRLNAAIAGNGGVGIPQGAGGSARSGGAYSEGLVQSNIFAINYSAGGDGFPRGSGSAGGLSTSSGSVDHNLYFDNTANGRFDDGATGSAAVFGDPLFVSRWGVRWDSPAKDKGSDDGPASDVLGRPRGRVVTIGAGEPLQRPRGDFDRDGRSDVFWRNAVAAQERLWFMNGALISSSGPVDPQPSTWDVAGVGDFNGDDYADILWHNGKTGAYAVWLMLGTLIADPHPIGSADSTWTVGGIGDFNRDGRDDILFRNAAMNTVAIWFMSPSATITPRTIAMTMGPEWSILGVGDFDGDRVSDVLWRNSVTNDVTAWLMDGETIRTSVNYGSALVGWRALAIADFDADGRSDVRWFIPGDANNSLWSLDGTRVRYSGPVSTPPSEWSLAAAGDFDGDGVADLFWRSSSGDDAVWLLPLALNPPRDTILIASEPDTNWLVAGPR